MIISILFGIGGWVIGLFGWAQIIGSFQSIKERGSTLTAATVIIWSIIMVGIALLFWKVVLVGHIKAILIGYLVSLVMILASGKIK